MKFPAIVLLIAYLVVGGEACDSDGLAQCVHNFESGHPEFQHIDTVAYTEQQLDAICGALPALRECVTPTLSGCDANERFDWDYLWNIAEYLCTEESRRVLAANVECFANASLENGFQACADSSYGYDDRQICNETKELVKCELDVMENRCGSDAADWYQGLWGAALKPSGEIYNCDFSHLIGGAPTVGTSLMSCLAVLGLSFLVAW